MTKEKILSVFEDINLMYNNPNMYDVLSKMLDELVEDSKKSVEPERKPGKWLKVVDEKTSISTTWHYKCSICESRKGWNDCDYCPSCGAKMEVDG